MGVVENLKDMAELAQKVGQIDLYKRILQAEDEVRELTRENRRLEDKVDELDRALRLKTVMKFREPLYYQDGEDTPYCARCFEKDDRAVHVVCLDRKTKTEWFCKACKEMYYLDGGSVAFGIANMQRG